MYLEELELFVDKFLRLYIIAGVWTIYARTVV